MIVETMGVAKMTSGEKGQRQKRSQARLELGECPWGRRQCRPERQGGGTLEELLHPAGWPALHQLRRMTNEEADRSDS